MKRNPIFDAEFISAPEKWLPVSPLFRKCFELTGKISRAVLHISALGVYEARINGHRVGDRYMTPGWTEYHKRVQYQSYDVTDMLGDNNELTVGLGHGWYSSRGGFIHTKNGMFGNRPAIILALDILKKDGGRVTVLSDGSFEVANSEVLSSIIYDGEICDATVTPLYTNEICIRNDIDKSILIPDESEPVRETERLAVKEVIHTPKGETVLDFGQNMTGVVEFRIENGHRGNTVILEHGEVLDADGNFYIANYRTAKSSLTYTERDGEQVYKAKYTFFGFRYVRLTGWGEKIAPDNFTAIVMHSDMRRTGYFECGHEKINKLYSNVIWGQRGNFLDVPTDCPQRDERLGWTGDAEVFARTACINYDTEKFYTKWLRDVMLDQTAEGNIPYVIPYVLDNRDLASAAWGDVATVLPWELYRAYGNKSLLREHLPMMRRWVAFIKSKSDGYIWRRSKHFGDWLGLDARPGSYAGSTDKALIGTAYFYHSTLLTAKACEALGYKSDKYVRLAKRIKNAYIRTFIKRGKLTSDTQTAHVLTLHFGLVTKGEAIYEALVERLVRLVEDNGDRLTTGFVGTPYLLDTLTEIGRADKSYALLCQERFPSWLYSVNKGATTIWEHWDGIKEDGSFWSTDMNSFNHYAYGAVASWMYGTALGIKPIDVAYRTFSFAPIPSERLGFAKGSIDTRSGRIEAEWRYEGEKIKYSLTVPEGTVAEVALPSEKPVRLEAGRYVMWGDKISQ